MHSAGNRDWLCLAGGKGLESHEGLLGTVSSWENAYLNAHKRTATMVMGGEKGNRSDRHLASQGKCLPSLQ